MKRLRSASAGSTSALALLSAAAFMLGLLSASLPRLQACYSTSVSNHTCADPTMSTTNCPANKVNMSSKWGSDYVIDNTMPTNDATVGWRIKIVQQTVGMMNATTVYDTNDQTFNSITCNQTYKGLENQTFDTSNWNAGAFNCQAPCHQSMAPGTHFEFSIHHFALFNFVVNHQTDEVDTSFVDSGC